MIDLHYWTTPNGHKIAMFLEETGLPYNIVPVNLVKNEQFEPKFLEIAPNDKMPAIVDHDPIGGGAPISIFESGAILLYLTEKTGQLMPQDIRGRFEVMQWLFWQVAGLGPMPGQLIFFLRSSEKYPFGIERFTKETQRLFGADSITLGATMSKGETQTLFTSFALGDRQLRNRIVMAPMTRGPARRRGKLGGRCIAGPFLRNR